jgi:hypothetical protein
LEELAWYDTPSIVNPVIERSSFRQLLPRLEILIFDLHVLKTVTDAEVRSAVSRTLVDCGLHELSDLSLSPFHPVHLRVYDLDDTDASTRLATLDANTADLTAYIESKPSLPLRTVYLTCADPATVHLSSASQGYVEDLSRVCQERKIDLIFEAGPTRYSRVYDPCFSPGFSRRMKEARRRDAVQ